MSNKMIRRIIRNYIKRVGKKDTRFVIDTFSNALGTTKQRISGNLSCMNCIEGSITIVKNKPHSTMY